MDIFNIKKVKKLEDKIALLERDLEREKNNVATFKEILKNNNESRKYLEEENQKLIKWIKSILEEFGTMEVRERSTVHIPVYKRSDIMFFRSANEEIPRYKEKIVVIPEIVIHERNY